MGTTPAPVDPTRVRPALRPALRVLRRDRLTLQVGTDPQRAVAYAVTDPVLIDLVCALDGRRSVVELAARHRVEVAVVELLVAELASAGLVEDADRTPIVACCPAGHPRCTEDHAASGGRGRSRRREVTEAMRRLEPDLAAWDLLEPAGDGGRAEWERRAGATVQVLGSGRVGLAVGLLLGAAGIGRVVAGDEQPARQVDRGALALSGVDVGRPRRDGLRRRLAEVAPATRLLDSRQGGAGWGADLRGAGSRGVDPENADPDADGRERPDLVVLASETAPDRALAAALCRRGIAHLVLTVTETVAVLGPFVRPGASACVRCLDLFRADRDPAWPLVLDRLTGAGTGSGPAGVGCDDVLTTMAAAHAVLHCTTALRGQRPPTVDSTYEFRLPAGDPRRRSWRQHPGCGCDWGGRPTLPAPPEDNGRCERPAP